MGTSEDTLANMVCARCARQFKPRLMDGSIACIYCGHRHNDADNADLLDIARGRKRAPAPAPTPAPQPERTSGTAALLREAAVLLAELSEAAMNRGQHVSTCRVCGYRIKAAVGEKIGVHEYAHASDCPILRARAWLRRVELDGER